MFVALFSEHVPLKDVAKSIKYKKLKQFFLNLNKSIPNEKIAVLGLNPHAGDNGVLGNEETIIKKAIKSANKKIGFEQFVGILVPDIAFTPHIRKKYKYFVAMYHDQGLAPLKALYFDESINISLNLPIIRTSVDHGTAFDIAYKGEAKTLSYINAIKSALSF
jgi:4-hydroxythreonine-4-phosphate dehydrogenase